ncbi:MAG: sigma-70 family RNA polymerase sigma factor [Luteolibacter sp.]
MNIPPSSFHSTRWTLVRQAGLRSDAGQAALSELCGIYYEPVFRFIRSRSADEDLARDLTHAFFEEMLVRENVGSPDPEKGRFRSYLLGGVKHFLARRHELRQSAKRGGGVEHVDLDGSADFLSSEDSQAGFDRDWALALIRRALVSLEEEMTAVGKTAQFRVLQPWLDGGTQGSHAEAAEALGLSENALNVTIHRLRQRFRILVRGEVVATTTSQEDADDEFRHLVEVLTAGG